jgi:hypothetical protein
MTTHLQVFVLDVSIIYVLRTDAEPTPFPSLYRASCTLVQQLRLMRNNRQHCISY